MEVYNKMVMLEQVNRAYVRRRAGQEWFLNDKPLDVQILIHSIEEDCQIRISFEEAKQLLSEYVGKSNRTELEQEFIGAMRELGIENPEFTSKLKIISI
jgi:hypothetical protein